LESARDDQGQWRVSEASWEGLKCKNLYPTSNITIATFAEFSLYKKEAYDANLWAGKILAEHGVPVAYKSVGCAKIPRASFCC
jgi:hypothetical protein